MLDLQELKYQRPNDAGVWWDAVSDQWVLACVRPFDDGAGGYIRKLACWLLTETGCEPLGSSEQIATGDWIKGKDLTHGTQIR